VVCFSFIYFRVQLEFSRNATSMNKTALVDTKCDLRRLSVRLSSRIQLCLCLCLSAAAALHNALQFHLKRTCLDILLFIALCSQSVYRATELLEVASSRLSGCVNYSSMLLYSMSNYHTHAKALASPLSCVLIEIMF